MKRRTDYKQVPTWFAPATQFKIRPLQQAPVPAGKQGLERLKNRLLAEQLEQLAQPNCDLQVRQAANDAASLAWVSAYPLLVFPVLFEEKLAAAFAQSEQQERILQVSRDLLAV